MSGISSVGSTITQPTTTSTTAPSTTTSTATQGTSSLPFTTYQDALGVPLAGGSLGLPGGGAPGDTEAILMMVELKLRRTIGTTTNNATESRASRYVQTLQQAQQLIADIIDASLELTNSQIQYQTNATALNNNASKLELLYAPLTGSGSQQDIDQVTADANGSQGTYGQYLAALQDYRSKSGAYTSITTQVNADQTAYDSAVAAASKTDPNAYYLGVYQVRVSQQQSLTAKQQQLAALKPPQSLSASEQAQLTTLNGGASTPGSVAEASARYDTLNAAVGTTLATLRSDQGLQATALTNRITAERQLVPYLDYAGGNSFIDRYPQGGSSATYTFDPQALVGTTPKTTGIISSSLNPITELTTNKKALQQAQTNLAKTIQNDQALLADAQTVLLKLTSLADSLASVMSQNTTDQTTAQNQNSATDATLQKRFDRNDANLNRLGEAQDLLSQIDHLRRRIAALLSGQAGQAALRLAADVTNTLSALAQLVSRPPTPTSTDVFQPGNPQSSAPRLRIPV